jgi:hypothetical protein
MLSLPHTSSEAAQSDPLLTRMFGGVVAALVATLAEGFPPCTIPHSIRIRPAPKLSSLISVGMLISEQSTPMEVI